MIEYILIIDEGQGTERALTFATREARDLAERKISAEWRFGYAAGYRHDDGVIESWVLPTWVTEIDGITYKCLFPGREFFMARATVLDRPWAEDLPTAVGYLIDALKSEFLPTHRGPTEVEK